jgi:hypothetical protein
VVVGHPLLRDEHLFGAVDHEVAALVVGALAQVGEVAVGAARQVAVVGAQHDGDLADPALVVLGDLRLGLAAVLAGGAVPARLAAGRGAPRDHVLLHVHVERRRVGEVAQARLLGEDHHRLAVGLHKGGLGQVDLAEPDLDLALLLLLVHHHPRVVLVLGRDREHRVLVHDLLQAGVDEVVERVQLLPHQALLLKVRADDGPARRRATGGDGGGRPTA